MQQQDGQPDHRDERVGQADLEGDDVRGGLGAARDPDLVRAREVQRALDEADRVGALGLRVRRVDGRHEEDGQDVHDDEADR